MDYFYSVVVLSCSFHATVVTIKCTADNYFSPWVRKVIKPQKTQTNKRKYFAFRTTLGVVQNHLLPCKPWTQFSGTDILILKRCTSSNFTAYAKVQIPEPVRAPTNSSSQMDCLKMGLQPSSQRTCLVIHLPSSNTSENTHTNKKEQHEKVNNNRRQFTSKKHINPWCSQLWQIQWWQIACSPILVSAAALQLYFNRV